MRYYLKLMKTLEFEIDGKSFFFQYDENLLKILANSHPHIEKLIRGALCKKFIEKLELFMGRETNLVEALSLISRAD